MQVKAIDKKETSKLKLPSKPELNSSDVVIDDDVVSVTEGESARKTSVEREISSPHSKPSVAGSTHVDTEEDAVILLEVKKQENVILKQNADDERSPRASDSNLSVRKRARHKCPVTACSSKNIVHLPHHLRDVHGWCREKSLSAISQFDLRKEKNRKVRE